MGADWPLVQDALIVAGLAFGAGALGVALLRRRRKPQAASRAGSLEDRVRVLERIATDRSADLAKEIDRLQDTRETN